MKSFFMAAALLFAACRLPEKSTETACRNPVDPAQIAPTPRPVDGAFPLTAVHPTILRHLDIKIEESAVVLPELAGAARNGAAGKRKVLLVGWDGVRRDSVLKALTPHLDKTAAAGGFYNAYAGGIVGTVTEQATISGPGWAAVLTGTWVNKHSIKNNDISDILDSIHDEPLECSNVPSLLKVASSGGYSVGFTSAWFPLALIVFKNTQFPLAVEKTGLENISDSVKRKDSEVVELAKEFIGQDRDVIAAILVETDNVGHKSKFSPDSQEYLDAINVADRYTGQLIDAIRQRPSFESEDWLVLVTTDHGGKENVHSGQSAEERNVFIVQGRLPPR